MHRDHFWGLFGLAVIMGVAMKLAPWVGMSPLDLFWPVLLSAITIGAWWMTQWIWNAGQLTLGPAAAVLWITWTAVLGQHAIDVMDPSPWYAYSWVRAVVFSLLCVVLPLWRLFSRSCR